MFVPKIDLFLTERFLTRPRVPARSPLPAEPFSCPLCSAPLWFSQKAAKINFPYHKTQMPMHSLPICTTTSSLRICRDWIGSCTTWWSSTKLLFGVQLSATCSPPGHGHRRRCRLRPMALQHPHPPPWSCWRDRCCPHRRRRMLLPCSRSWLGSLLGIIGCLGLLWVHSYYWTFQ